MSLTVAIQMDPIESIDIDADSTFVLALEAARRGYALSTICRTISRSGTGVSTPRRGRSPSAASGATISPWARRRSSTSPPSTSS